jgi:hypothetical protein
MSAIEALRRAREHGVTLTVCGGNLDLEAEREPAGSIMEALKRHKAEIIDLIGRSVPDWTSADWRSYFDERAGMAEFVGGQPRERAEETAMECCISEWINRNFFSSDPDRCGWCGEENLDLQDLLAFGTDEHGHVWLHSECWDLWHRKQREMARKFLASIGIGAPLASQGRALPRLE